MCERGLAGDWELGQTFRVVLAAGLAMGIGAGLIAAALTYVTPGIIMHHMITVNASIYHQRKVDFTDTTSHIDARRFHFGHGAAPDHAQPRTQGLWKPSLGVAFCDT